jgi:hypothetical protein
MSTTLFHDLVLNRWHVEGLHAWKNLYKYKLFASYIILLYEVRFNDSILRIDTVSNSLLNAWISWIKVSSVRTLIELQDEAKTQ